MPVDPVAAIAVIVLLGLTCQVLAPKLRIPAILLLLVVLAWIGPRGIVAAAVASLFALELSDAGIAEAERLAPLAFVVIIGTLSVAALTVIPVAQLLGLRSPTTASSGDPVDAE